MNYKAWAIDTGIRAVKTAAQTLVALLGAGAANVIHVHWTVDLGTAAFAGVVCVLQNIQTLKADVAAPAVPEVPAA